MFNFDEKDYFGKREHSAAEADTPNSDNNELNTQKEQAGKTQTNDKASDAPEATASDNNAAAWTSQDSTYHYGPSMQNNEANASRYPYGQPHNPYQQSSNNNQQTSQHSQQNSNQNQYPYNQPGGDRNPYSNYGYQPPIPPRPSFNQPFYNDPGKKNSNKGGKLVFGIMAAVICVLLIAVIVIISGGNDVQPETTVQSGEVTASLGDKTTSGNIVVADTQATPDEGSINSTDSNALSPSAIYRKVHESSVGLLVYDSASSSLSGEGSGVAYGCDDAKEYTYFVTCAHVISDKGAKIVVQTSDEMKFDAEIVGYDTRTDIGVIRVKGIDFQLATFGDSSALAVGSAVYAIGNPGGTEFAGSFTDGIVSAIDRPVRSNTGYDIDCIQHTAAINPGNSGGALVNTYGQIVGINSMKIVDDEYEGMGFAVPISVVIPVVEDIITYGYVANRPKLGISFYEASSYNYFYYYFVMSNNFGEGSIVVAKISEDGALAGTNVKVGDVITEVNGEKLDTSDDLADLVSESAVGDEITLTVVRPTDQRNVNQYDTFKVTITLVEDTGTTGEAEQQEETTVFDPFSYYWNYGN